MRVLGMAMGILVLTQGACYGHAQQSQQAMPAGQLVREVVYNELHDHQGHGYWRYWIKRRMLNETRLIDQVETAEGLVSRLSLSNGRPVSAEGQQEEQVRLDHLLSSPGEKARHRREYAEDEKQIGRIVALLPDAFLFEYAGEENGCHRLRFLPNPNYSAHSFEARIFHAMSGELWVSATHKRLVRLDGHLVENVDFGYGILGRLYKDGRFRLERKQVSATDWKTERLEVHMSGRAMIFKTIAREMSETRGGFVPVPAGMNLTQGMALLEQTETRAAVMTPTAFATSR